VRCGPGTACSRQRQFQDLGPLGQHDVRGLEPERQRFPGIRNRLFFGVARTGASRKLRKHRRPPIRFRIEFDNKTQLHEIEAYWISQFLHSSNQPGFSRRHWSLVTVLNLSRGRFPRRAMEQLGECDGRRIKAEVRSPRSQIPIAGQAFRLPLLLYERIYSRIHFAGR